MKRLLGLAVIVAAAPLWAGVRIKVDLTDLKTGKVTQQDILLDAERLRVDMGGEGGGNSVFFLTDGGRNRIVILDKSRNEYREMDQQTMAQMGQMMQGAMAQMQSQLANLPPEQRARVEQMMRGRMGQAGAAAQGPRTTFTAKGSSTANGFACTKYEGMSGAEKVSEVCAAKPADLHFSAADFQVFEKMREFTASLTANSPLANMRMADFAQQGFEGFPVQQTIFTGGQASMKTDVKSVDRANLSDADFSLGSARKAELMPGRGR